MNSRNLLTGSLLFRERKAERDAINRYRRVQSECLGYDIGFDAALVGWMLRHRKSWREDRKKLEDNVLKPSEIAVEDAFLCMA